MSIKVACGKKKKVKHFKSAIDLDTYTKPAGTLLYATCKAAYSYFLMHACICAFTVKKNIIQWPHY